jgi:MerR family copper efflux transcriptional regulator
MAQRGLTIGAAARGAGVTRKAVRVYEAKGLLPAAARTVTGYRLYDEHDVELLTFIRRARALGLHLDDIRKILEIRNNGLAPCATVRDLLDDRIAELDNTVAELLALRETLVQTRQRAADCTEQQPITVCGIIEDAVPAPPSGARG